MINIKDIDAGAITNHVVSKFTEIEEQLIREVLKNLLHRDADVEDFKKCEKHIYDREPNQYRFIYDGVWIGIVKYNFPIFDWFDVERKTDYKQCGVSFEPAANYAG